MSVLVEAFAPGEGDRLRTLRLRALRTDPDAFYRTHAEEVDRPPWFWDKWLARDDGSVVVRAVLDGRDVGLAGLVPDRRGTAGTLAVITFWVDPAARGCGAGRAMLADLERRARDAGAVALTLEVADSNEAAGKFYAAAGFEPTGRTGAFAAPREHVTEHERRKDL